VQECARSTRMTHKALPARVPPDNQDELKSHALFQSESSMLAYKRTQIALSGPQSRFAVAWDVLRDGIRKMAVRMRWLWDSGFSGDLGQLPNGCELRGRGSLDHIPIRELRFPSPPAFAAAPPVHSYELLGDISEFFAQSKTESGFRQAIIPDLNEPIDPPLRDGFPSP